MRAVVMRSNRLIVAEVPTPTPGAGEVLVRTLACGICGTDLHVLRYAKAMAEAPGSFGGLFAIDPGRDVVMGHEFCAEVVEYGPETRKRLKCGTRVCSIPVLKRRTGDESIGYSCVHPGGFGEMMRLSEDILLEVPKGVDPEVAAMTEPMAVAYHAVAKAKLDRRTVTLVIGCGPVGLSIIAVLKANGIGPIVGADFSPVRRGLALRMGADLAVDPHEQSPYNAVDLHGSKERSTAIFECVGKPLLLDEIVSQAPKRAKIIVAGLCMEPDRLNLLRAAQKEVTVQFVLGYDGDEFGAAFRLIMKGKLPVQALITSRVALADVAAAFDYLGSPQQHGKIVVEPWRT